MTIKVLNESLYIYSNKTIQAYYFKASFCFIFCFLYIEKRKRIKKKTCVAIASLCKYLKSKSRSPIKLHAITRY